MKKLILIFLLPITVFGQYTIQNNTNSVTILPSSIQASKTNDNDGTSIALGKDALKNNYSANTWGRKNVALGYSSLFNNGIGATNSSHASSNIAIGSFALYNNGIGNGNLAIGISALASNINGIGNIAIGNEAGFVENDSYKLYIHPLLTTKPLIWGDFSLRLLGFHGNVGIQTKTPIDLLNIHDESAIPKSYAGFTSGLTGQTVNDGLKIGITEFNEGMIINYENNPLVFGTNAIGRMVISEDGNVGIGTTGGLSGNLHVHQSVSGPVYFHLTDQVTGTALTDGLTIAVGPQFAASIAQRENAPLIIGAGSGGFNQLYLKENGNIGLSTDQPEAKLDINGFTKLGPDAPKIKLKKITTTTGANQGDMVTIAHGLTSTKIIAANVLVDYGTGEYISHHYTISGGYEFHFVINTTSIEIKTKNGNSGNILNKPVKILITYEE